MPSLADQAKETVEASQLPRILPNSYPSLKALSPVFLLLQAVFPAPLRDSPRPSLDHTSWGSESASHSHPPNLRPRAKALVPDSGANHCPALGLSFSVCTTGRMRYGSCRVLRVFPVPGNQRGNVGGSGEQGQAFPKDATWLPGTPRPKRAAAAIRWWTPGSEPLLDGLGPEAPIHKPQAFPEGFCLLHLFSDSPNVTENYLSPS